MMSARRQQTGGWTVGASQPPSRHTKALRPAPQPPPFNPLTPPNRPPAPPRHPQADRRALQLHQGRGAVRGRHAVGQVLHPEGQPRDHGCLHVGLRVSGGGGTVRTGPGRHRTAVAGAAAGAGGRGGALGYMKTAGPFPPPPNRLPTHQPTHPPTNSPVPPPPPPASRIAMTSTITSFQSPASAAPTPPRSPTRPRGTKPTNSPCPASSRKRRPPAPLESMPPRPQSSRQPTRAASIRGLSAAACR